MNIQSKHNITIQRAEELLKEGAPLIDVYVRGKLKIETNEIWKKEVVFQNCIVEYFSGSDTGFYKPVKFINCHLKNCQFLFTYFLGGLIIENCIFDNYLDFQAGGHNKTGNSIILKNNKFSGFVNFFDCLYENEVIIINNNFEKGTNLLGKPHNITVTFDRGKIIEDNIGELNLNNEGERE